MTAKYGSTSTRASSGPSPTTTARSVTHSGSPPKSSRSAQAATAAHDNRMSGTWETPSNHAK